MSTIPSLDHRVAVAFFGKFPRLRPPQEQAIRPLLEGKNLVLCSGTGSGKTEAVMAPIVSRFWRSALQSGQLFILYIAPTKALVNDLEKRLFLPLNSLGLRVGVRHGDRDDLKRGERPHVLITTPESLDVMLFRGDEPLRGVRAVVVDEVHLLYNTQRGLHLSVLLRRLCKRTSESPQIVMLSATIGRLSDVTDFILGVNESAEHLSFPSERSIDAQIRYVPSDAAFLRLFRRLTEGGRIKLLVFANSRRECERLAGILSQDSFLSSVVLTHYSSLSSEVRLQTEKRFSELQTAVCLATSTLELGIDIGDIDAVMLWNVPGSVESFLQRVGRGNRRSSKTNVVCLVPPDSTDVVLDALRFATLVDTARKGELPVRSPFELFGAVAQQTLNMIAADGGVFKRVAELCECFDHRGYLSRPLVEDVLGELAGKDYLQRHGFKNRYGAGDHLHSLLDYRLIYGNFSVGSQTVDIFHGAKRLGEVPAINLLRLRRGHIVRFAGRCWQVADATQEKIRLDPAHSARGGVDFIYPGTITGWDSFLSNRLWEIIHSASFPYDLLSQDILDRVKPFLDRVERNWPRNSIPYQRTTEGLRYVTFAGYNVNKAVGLITQKPSFQADDISLTVPSTIEWRSIPDNPFDFEPVFHLLFEASAEQSLYQSLLPLDLQQKEFLQHWLKDETIPTVLNRLQNSEPVEGRWSS